LSRWFAVEFYVVLAGNALNNYVRCKGFVEMLTSPRSKYSSEHFVLRHR